MNRRNFAGFGDEPIPTVPRAWVMVHEVQSRGLLRYHVSIEAISPQQCQELHDAFRAEFAPTGIMPHGIGIWDRQRQCYSMNMAQGPRIDEWLSRHIAPDAVYWPQRPQAA